MSNLTWKGNLFEQREFDNYVCLTQMAKIFDKKVNDWSKTDSSRGYLQAVSTETNIPATELLIISKGGNDKDNQGTWAHPLIAIAFAQWLSPEFHVWCNLHIKLLIEAAKPQQPELPKVTDETLKVHLSCIEFFTNSGDIQLAQLLKNRIGNLVLAEQHQLLTGTVVEQLEGVVEVALRLGFQVPKNFECTLGKYVKQQCSHLARGVNQRYSNASAKQIPATMYPVNNPEVEGAVLDYCVMKSFRSDRIKLG
jgi:hypothetical protein